MSNEAHEAMETLLSVGSFAFCSVAMILTNKLAIGAFPFESSLTALQMFATVLLLLPMGPFHIGARRDLMRWSMVSPFFAGWLLTSLLAVKHCSLTFVIVLRTMSPIFSLAFESFRSKSIDRQKMMAIVVMVLGAVIYTHRLSWNTLKGAGWVALNVAFSVLTRLLQRHLLSQEGDPVDISKTGCTLINNLFGLVPLLIIGYLCDEFNRAPESLASASTSAHLLIALSCLVGLGISYTNVWCQSRISATNMLILVNFCRFLVILIESTLLREALSALELCGAFIILFGGLVLTAPAKEGLVEEEHKEIERLVKV